MKKIFQLISWVALVLLVSAPALFYVEKITLETNKALLLAATIIWFASALCWMGREKESE
ncbi:hypothetical protein P4C99_06225 [Pontiellaceae bacterium B1224]|nr:hypothetical protein [Pontiellaceae bacterium B1224]